ncbi:MAG TPA: hypothetical protein VMU57_10035 [Edaphobacter sp.]|uniref:hypothetical protein n=1 Tax=Edaphobacter sp. TaxID=1934404 RepID=UPI002C911C17|nr:hypothetical protein [Edaphobacter sp.]HUZ95239.1 hypothetical protein [Edaphobacter sp.]
MTTLAPSLLAEDGQATAWLATKVCSAQSLLGHNRWLRRSIYRSRCHAVAGWGLTVFSEAIQERSTPADKDGKT